MKVSLFTFDTSHRWQNLDELTTFLTRRIDRSIQDGAPIILFPELMWMSLFHLANSSNVNSEVADMTWNHIVPAIAQRYEEEDVFLVLGSGPYELTKGVFRNRAPVVSKGNVYFQDKIHLTPWETDYQPGFESNYFVYNGIKIAIAICLDIELPYLSITSRNQEVDLILVPSATDRIFGHERISRCASARAVELSCATGVAHLVGRSEFDLIDYHLGGTSYFLPSQSTMADEQRVFESAMIEQGEMHTIHNLPIDGLKKARENTKETNPFHLHLATPELKFNTFNV